MCTQTLCTSRIFFSVNELVPRRSNQVKSKTKSVPAAKILSFRTHKVHKGSAEKSEIIYIFPVIREINALECWNSKEKPQPIVMRYPIKFRGFHTVFSFAGLSSAIPVVHLQVIVQASLLPLYNPGFSLNAITDWLWFGFWGFSKILRGKKLQSLLCFLLIPGVRHWTGLRGRGSTHQVMELFLLDSVFGQN